MRIVARAFALLSLLWVEGVWAGDCPDYDYVLTSQAEIDALGAANCTYVLVDTSCQVLGALEQSIATLFLDDAGTS